MFLQPPNTFTLLSINDILKSVLILREKYEKNNKEIAEWIFFNKKWVKRRIFV